MRMHQQEIGTEINMDMGSQCATLSTAYGASPESRGTAGMEASHRVSERDDTAESVMRRHLLTRWRDAGWVWTSDGTFGTGEADPQFGIPNAVGGAGGRVREDAILDALVAAAYRQSIDTALMRQTWYFLNGNGSVGTISQAGTYREEKMWRDLEKRHGRALGEETEDLVSIGYAIRRCVVF